MYECENNDQARYELVYLFQSVEEENRACESCLICFNVLIIAQLGCMPSKNK